MNGAAFYAYFGLACGVMFAVLLAVAVCKAGREADEEAARAAAEEGAAARRVALRRALLPTEKLVPLLPPTETESAEVLVEAEAACREATLR